MSDGTCVIYRQDPRVASRVFRGEAAIIPPRDRRVTILNEVATEIWELCLQGRSLDQLCVALSDRYDASVDTIRRDTQELLDKLVAIGALIVSSVDGSEGAT